MRYYNTGTRLDRIAARVETSVDCWRWAGFIDVNGYGKLGRDWAHRAMWEETVGPIESGLVIDHLCRNRACVNPDHLEPVSMKENLQRGDTTVAVTHCRKGHALTEDNVYIINAADYVRRKCRTCQLANMARQRAKRKAAS